MRPASAAFTDVDPPFVLSGTIEPTRLSMLYRVGLVVVAIGMLLLPFLYLMVIVGTAAAVWWHLQADTWLLSGGGQWRVLAYIAPAVVGAILVFFMVKPVLARPARRKDPLVLSPTEAPDLFAFIQQICQQVHAPLPRLVQVDCQVNASASFMPGRMSVTKRDLVLTIGLPLATGLSVRELGGVLAHEFGHFAQGGGMRVTSLVRGVNHWFARVVYERDHWDEKLEEWSREGDARAGVILGLARGCIWLSRKFLYGLMMAGHAISCFMMRQMEYDADSYEIKFAGSDTFVRTSARMRELNVAMQFGYEDLRHSWRQQALPSDFPAFMFERVSRVPQEVLAKVHDVSGQTTGLLDTHPSDADRTQAAERAAATGVLVGGNDPATRLFRDFDTLSAAATRHHYEHEWGINLDGIALVGLGDAVHGSRRRQQEKEAIATFFGGCLSVLRPLYLPLNITLQAGDTELRELQTRTRETMAELAVGLERRYRRFEECVLRQKKAYAAEEVIGAGVPLTDAEGFEVAEATLAGAQSTQSWAVEQQQLESSALEGFESAAAQRLACGLALAGRKVSSDEIDRICDVFNAVVAVLPHVQSADRLLAAGTILGRSNPGPDALLAVKNRIQLLSAGIEKSLEQVRGGLGDRACPVQFTTSAMTAAAWCGLSPPEKANAPDVIENVLTFYMELLGQIVVIVRTEEAPIGTLSPADMNLHQGRDDRCE